MSSLFPGRRTALLVRPFCTNQLMCPCLTNGYIFSAIPDSKVQGTWFGMQTIRIPGRRFLSKESTVCRWTAVRTRSGPHLLAPPHARGAPPVLRSRPWHAAHKASIPFPPCSKLRRARRRSTPIKGTHAVRATYSEQTLTCFLTNACRQITGWARTYSVPTRRRRSLCLKAQRT